MTFEAPTLLASAPLDLDGSDPVVTFPTTGGGFWEVWDRYLALRDDPVFEIGNICGTCTYWFRRLPAKAEPVDVEAVQDRLTAGLTGLEAESVGAFAGLLQPGAYIAALFSLTPRCVVPGSEADYFTSEQPADWKDLQDDEREDPGIPYYRVGDAAASFRDPNDDRFFDFIIPLQPPEALDPARINFFEDRLARGDRPTAVAVSVLDIRQYYDSLSAHWCLGHYLLDGHHKVEAASRSGRPITLLSFIADGQGISSPEQAELRLSRYESPAR